MFCTKCGSAVDSNAKFCKKCGDAITSETQAINVAGAVINKPLISNKYKKKSAIFAIAGITSLLLIIFLVSQTKTQEPIVQNEAAPVNTQSKQIDSFNENTAETTPKEKSVKQNLEQNGQSLPSENLVAVIDMVREDGYGTTTFNGNRYAGQWKNGRANGEGVNTFSNGDIYEGEWKDGKPNGKGSYTYANGTEHVGEFKDGKPVDTKLSNNVEQPQVNAMSKESAEEKTGLVAEAESERYEAILSCGMSANENLNILACFAAGGGAQTELEIKNGSQYGMYKAHNISSLGRLERDGLHIDLQKHFAITAQNSHNILLLNLKVIDWKGDVLFQKSASQYGVISVSN
jgi:hypothetical protein